MLSPIKIRPVPASTTMSALGDGRPAAAAIPVSTGPADAAMSTATAVAARREPRYHHYSSPPGLPERGEAIACKTKRDSGVDCSAAQVVVTNGAKHAVYNTFQVLCDEGDEVLVPAPYWTTYPEVIALAG